MSADPNPPVPTGDPFAPAGRPSTPEVPEVPAAAETAEAIEAVSALSDDSRRRMFAFIRRAGRPITRDEAAASVGISRKLAAFHLDKLVDAGLLLARYGTPGGIRKVGRQPKVYEPADTQIQINIPERRHGLLAELLLDAVLDERADENGRQAAVRTAHEHGLRLGSGEREQLRPGRLGAERGLTACERLLEGYGFEPVREAPTQVRLHNCPFHPMAAKAPELVCGMNHAFLAGLLAGLQITGVHAVLDPHPGECCVRLTGDEGAGGEGAGDEGAGDEGAGSEEPEGEEPGDRSALGDQLP